MIWHEPFNHFDDCYFCMTNLVGYNKKNRKNIIYPSIPSATRPIPEKNPVPVFNNVTNVTFYRNKEATFLPCFKQYEEIVVCNDVELLIMELGIAHYEANSWRLFIDSSKRSLKYVLLHNTNEYASIPIGHSTTLKEKYEPVKQVLECIKYNSITGKSASI